MLGNGLGHTIEDSFKIEKLCGQLYLHNDNTAFRILCLNVYPIKLVVNTFLIAFALKNLHDGDLLTEQHGDKAFEHIKIGFVTKHPLHSPVKSYVLFVDHHFSFLCRSTVCFHSYLILITRCKDKAF